MKKQITDRKHWLTYAFFSRLNAFVIGRRFKSVEVINRELIPSDRPFILISNHISRWDGLIVYRLIDRPANFMVSPNELQGMQGLILQSMGAFPASAKIDLQSHVKQQLAKNEGVVIFPEGDVYRDGTTHPFKTGTARLALNLSREGQDIPIIPIAIQYSDDTEHVKVLVSNPVSVTEYATMLNSYQHENGTMDNNQSSSNFAESVRALTDRLYREVCHLRLTLGAAKEAAVLFASRQKKSWTKRMPAA